MLAVVFQKLVRRLERRTLIAVYKWMITRDCFRIARGELENILLAVGILVLRPSKSRFEQTGIPQALRAAADAIGLTKSGTADVELERLPQRGARG